MPQHSTPMPPYRAVLVVDAEKYSRTSSVHQKILHTELFEVLEWAFAHSGLEEQWRTASFAQSTGDGYLVGVDPRYLSYLIDPLLDNLQVTLQEVQPRLAYHDRELRLRLRASIDVGPLPDSGGAERGDGIGTPMNNVHRLLDSEAVRAGLGQTDPEITLVAGVLSRRAYTDAVRGGFVGTNERLFRAEYVRLPDKEYEAEGYIYIPRPSGRGDAHGAGPPKSAPDRDPTAAAPHPTRRAAGEHDDGVGETANHRTGDNSGRIVQAGAVHGGATMDDTTNIHRRGGVGGIFGGVENVVTDPQGPVNTGEGTQVNAPQFHNRGGVNYVAGSNNGAVRGDGAGDNAARDHGHGEPEDREDRK